jgi:hypothetical protein
MGIANSRGLLSRSPYRNIFNNIGVVMFYNSFDGGNNTEYRFDSLEMVRDCVALTYHPVPDLQVSYMPEMIWKQDRMEFRSCGDVHAKMGVGFTEDDEVIFFVAEHMPVGEIPKASRNRPKDDWWLPTYKDMRVWVPKEVSLEKPMIFIRGIGRGFNQEGETVYFKDHKFTLGGMEFRFENSDVESICIAD